MTDATDRNGGDGRRDGNGADAGVESPTDRRLLAQGRYDPAEDYDLTSEIVYALADAVGVAPTDLLEPPLYDVVDVAAVEDAFFGRGGAGRPTRSDGRVEFRYLDYLVEVRSDGWIRVYEAGTVPTA